MWAHRPQQQTISETRQQPIAISMGRRLALLLLLPTISVIRRLLIETDTETLLGLHQHPLIISATQLRRIVIVTAIQQVPQDQIPITLVIPIPLIQTPMAVQQVHRRHLQITLATQQRHIVIVMGRHKVAQRHPQITSEIEILSNVATIQTLLFGVGNQLLKWIGRAYQIGTSSF